MATVIRPELSIKNEYWIDKHRYYELKHFCLQYNEWKRLHSESDGYGGKSSIASLGRVGLTSRVDDGTARYAIERDIYAGRIKMVEDAAISADSVLYKYLLKAVTEGLSFTYLKTKLGMPCGRSTYYKIYRRFFWLLDDMRN